MKFQTTSYHFNLLKDEQRLAVFYEAILDYVKNQNKDNLIAFDVGCGSGVLSFFAQPFFKEIFSCEIDSKTFNCTKNNLKDFDNISLFEIDSKTFNCTKNNLKDFDNISLFNDDATAISFNKKADLIICEMLDTALIDEEQVPVLKNVKKYLKDNGEIIPQGIFNLAQLVNMEREYFHYDDVGENINYEPLSNEILYSKINFLDDINPKFEGTLDFKIRNDGEVNGVKITTVTKLNENIVCGPTPMLNPPLLIPLDNLNVKRNDLIRLNLKYIMGKGIETIKTEYVR